MGYTWILLPGPGRPRQTETPDSRLAETKRLAAALGLRVAEARSVRIRKPTAATLFGSGFVRKVREDLRSTSSDLVIVDGILSPIQQRNLEREWECTVLDRTAVILKIFAIRARSREGRVQVEHARLSYEKSRLVRSWTHLERQRGGFGFLGGPGETQIEADRRSLDARLAKLDSQLKRIARNRRTQRGGRQRSGMKSVALVGYTNAGKSSLFNRLCDADADARDMLFATLDTSIRRLRLPHGRLVALSDTVGFISNLPAELVAAFRATLLEVTEADLVLHVIDASSEEWEAQRACVIETLEEIGVRQSAGAQILEVHNKADALNAEQSQAITRRLDRTGRGVLVSAKTGENISCFLKRMEQLLDTGTSCFRILLEPHGGSVLAWLYGQGAIEPERNLLLQKDEGDACGSASSTPIEVVARLSPSDRHRLQHRFGDEIREMHAVS